MNCLSFSIAWLYNIIAEIDGEIQLVEALNRTVRFQKSAHNDTIRNLQVLKLFLSSDVTPFLIYLRKSILHYSRPFKPPNKLENKWPFQNLPRADTDETHIKETLKLLHCSQVSYIAHNNKEHWNKKNYFYAVVM